ncbi:MAG TPA: hypothetical protein VFI13_09660, partial [Gemmatimonadales bacterium]|nr:hypothetical protein [Gemmatimonadales bacterium]
MKNVTLAALFVVATFGTPAAAQTPARDTTTVARLVASPAQLTVVAGQVVPLKVTAYDAQGRVVANPVLRAGGARGGMQLWPDSVKGLKAGDYEVVVTAVQLLPPGQQAITV